MSTRRPRWSPVSALERLEDRTLLTAYVVDTNLDDPAGAAGDTDGRLSLREAIHAANSNAAFGDAVAGSGTTTDTITFAASLAGGTITLGGTRLDLTGDVAITGLGADSLTISGNDGAQIFFVAAGVTAEINGLTLTRGKAAGTTGDTRAGGAFYNNGTLSIFDSVLSGHTADVQGGAILNNGFLTISGSTLAENVAHYSGGAIYNIDDANSDGTLTITDSVLTRNSIIAGGGGAISNWGGSVTIANGTFSENHAENDGGAITNAFGGDVTITHSNLFGNTVRHIGGAIYTTSGTFAIANSTVSGNTALEAGGGGIRTEDGLLTLTNVTVFGNRADGDGDGRGPGGGLFVAGSGTTVLNNTLIAGNVRGAADGTETPDDIVGVVDVASCNNLIGDAANAGGLIDGTNGNIVGVDWTTVIDPVLADNGGSTLTHALLVGSVAIDAGDDASAVDAAGNPLTTDQRGDGFDRIIGRAVDIGAFEASSLVVEILADEDDGDYSVGDLSLREAIGLSAAGGTINFDENLAGGTIVLGGTRLDLARNITITGLGADSLTISGNNLSQIFCVAAGVTAEISGLTLTRGRASGSTIDSNSGGAIFNGGALTIADSVLIGNSADGDGGGIYHHFSAGTLSITNCILSGNAGDSGGAIYNRARDLTIADSVFSGNSARFHGGAIYDFVGTLTVVSSAFDRNSTRFTGGAVGTNGGRLSFTDSIFTGNSAGSSGGAIENSAGILTVTRSTLSGNRTDALGGAIANRDGGVATVMNSTLSGNAADSAGGGVYNRATLTLTNTTLFGNRAEADGGEVSDGGGGLFVQDFADSTLLINTLIAGNVYGAVGGTETPDDIAGVVDVSSRNNLIGDAATSGGLTNGTNGNIVGIDWTTVVDPNLADNGGPTLTHALIEGSAAIDAGDNASAVDTGGNPLATDQRGERFDRMIGDGVDIGAFEVQTVLVPESDVFVDGVGTFRDGVWRLDLDLDGSFGPADTMFRYGLAGDKPIVGDWNGDGFDEVGVFRNGRWFLDMNGNRRFDAGDRIFTYGIAGDTPIAGDWDGDGRDEIGIHRGRVWHLDVNGDFRIRTKGDRYHSFGLVGDVPVVIDVDGNGTSNIGVYRRGVWSIDVNGSGKFEAGADAVFVFGGRDSQPVVGNWLGLDNSSPTTGENLAVRRGDLFRLDVNDDKVIGPADFVTTFGIAGESAVAGRWSRALTGGRYGETVTVPGRDEAATYRNGVFRLDTNGNGKVDAFDAVFRFGRAGDKPVAGDFDGDGFDEIGVYRGNRWHLDLNGSRTFDAGDRAFNFGRAGDQPVVGDWNGDGRDEIGVYRPSVGRWFLDLNYDFAFDVGDAVIQYGSPGDVAVVGDWNNDGIDEVGVYRAGVWIVDEDANRTLDSTDVSFAYAGRETDRPVVGDWDADGRSGDPGAIGGNVWRVDRDGDRVYENALHDMVFAYGLADDLLLTGNWQMPV